MAVQTESPSSRIDPDRMREPCGQIVEIQGETGSRVHVACVELRGHSGKHRSIQAVVILGAAGRKADAEIFWTER